MVTGWLSTRVRQVTRLGINAEGRIQCHEDLWSLADIIAGIPLLGRLYRAVQPVAGRLVSAAISKMYAWKAGSSIGSARFGTNTVHAVYHPVESQRIHAQQRLADKADADLTSSTASMSSSNSKKHRKQEKKGQHHESKEL